MNLKFSYNWNNKLHNTAFTTLRLENEGIYYKGAEKHVLLMDSKDNVKHDFGQAIIEEIRTLYLHEINNYIAFLDTGYNKTECQKILKKMHKNVDWKIQKLVLCLLVKKKEKASQEKLEL